MSQDGLDGLSSYAQKKQSSRDKRKKNFQKLGGGGGVLKDLFYDDNDLD